MALHFCVDVVYAPDDLCNIILNILSPSHVICILVRVLVGE